MKRTWTLLCAGILLAVGAGLVIAQEGRKARTNSGEGGQATSQPAAGQEHRRQMPPSPLLTALDTDKDGELSAEEIAAATQSLKKLDKNNDGKLSREELRPPQMRRSQGAERAGPEGGKRSSHGPEKAAGAEPAGN